MGEDRSSSRAAGRAPRNTVEQQQNTANVHPYWRRQNSPGARALKPPARTGIDSRARPCPGQPGLVAAEEWRPFVATAPASAFVHAGFILPGPRSAGARMQLRFSVTLLADPPGRRHGRAAGSPAARRGGRHQPGLVPDDLRHQNLRLHKEDRRVVAQSRGRSSAGRWAPRRRTQPDGS